jgi:hypothetical protein
MMIVPAGAKVHLALGYTDMRKGMDGLAIGITPYAAAQFVTFDLPAYAEQVIAGTNNSRSLMDRVMSPIPAASWASARTSRSPCRTGY